jgi:hypothetical protein
MYKLNGSKTGVKEEIEIRRSKNVIRCEKKRNQSEERIKSDLH